MKYEDIKSKAYRQYKKINTLYCPYLKVRVKFTGKGFWHIIYTGRNEKRDTSSQQLRFKLLEKAVQVIQLTTTLQEYEETTQIKYFGFIAIIDGWKIKIIIKQIGHGAPFFWSVIPNWVTNRKRDRLLHKGNMEKD